MVSRREAHDLLLSKHRFGQRLRRQPADADGEPEATKGVNAWPDQPEEVAGEEVVTQFAGAAEATQAIDREKWWQEQRDAGYSEEEIADMEESRVVPVFTADS